MNTILKENWECISCFLKYGNLDSAGWICLNDFIQVSIRIGQMRMKLVFSWKILEYKVQIFRVKKSFCSITGVKFWRGFRGRGEAETEGQEKAEEKSRCQEKEEQEVEASSAVIQ